MAPSALAAPELDQTNGDLHTTVDRKTAAIGLGDGKPFAYDPENPYLNVNVGLFHDAQVMAVSYTHLDVYKRQILGGTVL